MEVGVTIPVKINVNIEILGMFQLKHKFRHLKPQDFHCLKLNTEIPKLFYKLLSYKFQNKLVQLTRYVVRCIIMKICVYGKTRLVG